MVNAVLRKTPSPPSAHRPDLPLAIDTICARALAKERDDRYVSCADLIADLNQLSGDERESPLQALGSSSVVQASRPERRQITLLRFESSAGTPVFDGASASIRAAVERFGGHVLEATQASVTTCFGFPIDYEHDAEIGRAHV